MLNRCFLGVVSAWSFLAVNTAGDQPPPNLRNRDLKMRSPGCLEGLDLQARRGPVIRVDQREAKEGQQALCIEAVEPADVALGQVVSLPAGSFWRVRCWVKTQDLVARDQTDTGGSVHVQTPSGETLARGASTFGSTGWHESEAYFRVPQEGRVKIVLFYIGYGKGTGKAWFDDVRLDELRLPAEPEIQITGTRNGHEPVDAKQGGQFIELLCGLIPSMLAQQVATRASRRNQPGRWRSEETWTSHIAHGIPTAQSISRVTPTRRIVLLTESAPFESSWAIRTLELAFPKTGSMSRQATRMRCGCTPRTKRGCRARYVAWSRPPCGRIGHLGQRHDQLDASAREVVRKPNTRKRHAHPGL